MKNAQDKGDVRTMKREFGKFTISDDKELLDFEAIVGFLARSYWASKRHRTRIEESIKNSICYGVFDEGVQIGFARVVTDCATMYYLCDVFIKEEYRGHSLGKALVETIAESEPFRNLTGVLATKDAHGLYEKYGFRKDSERFMRRAADFLRT